MAIRAGCPYCGSVNLSSPIPIATGPDADALIRAGVHVPMTQMCQDCGQTISEAVAVGQKGPEIRAGDVPPSRSVAASRAENITGRLQNAQEMAAQTGIPIEKAWEAMGGDPRDFPVAARAPGIQPQEIQQPDASTNIGRQELQGAPAALQAKLEQEGGAQGEWKWRERQREVRSRLWQKRAREEQEALKTVGVSQATAQLSEKAVQQLATEPVPTATPREPVALKEQPVQNTRAQQIESTLIDFMRYGYTRDQLRGLAQQELGKGTVSGAGELRNALTNVFSKRYGERPTTMVAGETERYSPLQWRYLEPQARARAESEFYWDKSRLGPKPRSYEWGTAQEAAGTDEPLINRQGSAQFFRARVVREASFWLPGKEPGTMLTPFGPEKVSKRIQQTGTHELVDVYRRKEGRLESANVPSSMLAGPGSVAREEGTILRTAIPLMNVTPSGQGLLGQGVIQRIARTKSIDIPLAEGQEPTNLIQPGAAFGLGDDIVPFEGAAPLDLLREYAWESAVVKDVARTPAGIRMVIERSISPERASTYSKTGGPKQTMPVGDITRMTGRSDIEAIQQHKDPLGTAWQKMMAERPEELRQMMTDVGWTGPMPETWQQGGEKFIEAYKRVLPQITEDVTYSLRVHQSNLGEESGISQMIEAGHGTKTPVKNWDEWYDVQLTIPTIITDLFTPLGRNYPYRRPFYSFRELERMKRENPEMYQEVMQESEPTRAAYRSVIGAAAASSGKFEPPADAVKMTEEQAQVLVQVAQNRALEASFTPEQITGGKTVSDVSMGVLQRKAVEVAAEMYKGRSIQIGEGEYLAAPDLAQRFFSTAAMAGEPATRYEKRYGQALLAMGGAMDPTDLADAKQRALYAQSELGFSRHMMRRMLGAFVDPRRTTGGVIQGSEALAPNQAVAPEDWVLRAYGLRQGTEEAEKFISSWKLASRMSPEQAQKQGLVTPAVSLTANPTPGDEPFGMGTFLLHPLVAQEQGVLLSKQTPFITSIGMTQAQHKDWDADQMMRRVLGTYSSEFGIIENVAAKWADPGKVLQLGERAKSFQAANLLKEYGEGPQNLEGLTGALDISKWFQYSDKELQQASAADLGLREKIGPVYNLFEQVEQASGPDRLNAAQRLFNLSYQIAQRPHELPPQLEKLRQLGAFNVWSGGWRGTDKPEGGAWKGFGGLQGLQNALVKTMADLTLPGTLDPKAGSAVFSPSEAAALLAPPGAMEQVTKLLEQYGETGGGGFSSVGFVSGLHGAIGGIEKFIESPVGSVYLTRAYMKAKRIAETPFEKLSEWQQASGTDVKAQDWLATSEELSPRIRSMLEERAQTMEARRLMLSKQGVVPELDEEEERGPQFISKGEIERRAQERRQQQLEARASRQRLEEAGAEHVEAGITAAPEMFPGFVKKPIEATSSEFIEEVRKEAPEIPVSEIAKQAGAELHGGQPIINVTPGMTQEQKQDVVAHEQIVHGGAELANEMPPGAAYEDVGWTEPTRGMTEMEQVMQEIRKMGTPRAQPVHQPGGESQAQRVLNRMLGTSAREFIEAKTIVRQEMESGRWAAEYAKLSAGGEGAVGASKYVRRMVSHLHHLEQGVAYGGFPPSMAQDVAEAQAMLTGVTPSGEPMIPEMEQLKGAGLQVQQASLEGALAAPGQRGPSAAEQRAQQASQRAGLMQFGLLQPPKTPEEMREYRKAMYDLGVGPQGIQMMAGAMAGQKLTPGAVEHLTAIGGYQPELAQMLEGRMAGPEKPGDMSAATKQYTERVKSIGDYLETWRKDVGEASDSTRKLTKEEERYTAFVSTRVNELDRMEREAVRIGGPEGAGLLQQIAGIRGGKGVTALERFGQREEAQEMEARRGAAVSSRWKQGIFGEEGPLQGVDATLRKVTSGWELMRLQRLWGMTGGYAMGQIPIAAGEEMAAAQAAAVGQPMGQFRPGGMALSLMEYQARQRGFQADIGRAAYGGWGWAQKGATGEALATGVGIGGPALGAGLLAGTMASWLGLSATGVGIPVALGAAALGTGMYAKETMEDQERMAVGAARGPQKGGLDWLLSRLTQAGSMAQIAGMGALYTPPAYGGQEEYGKKILSGELAGLTGTGRAAAVRAATEEYAPKWMTQEAAMQAASQWMKYTPGATNVKEVYQQPEFEAMAMRGMTPEQFASVAEQWGIGADKWQEVMKQTLAVSEQVATAMEPIAAQWQGLTAWGTEPLEVRGMAMRGELERQDLLTRTQFGQLTQQALQVRATGLQPIVPEPETAAEVMQQTLEVSPVEQQRMSLQQRLIGMGAGGAATQVTNMLGGNLGALQRFEGLMAGQQIPMNLVGMMNTGMGTSMGGMGGKVQYGGLEYNVAEEMAAPFKELLDTMVEIGRMDPSTAQALTGMFDSIKPTLESTGLRMGTTQMWQGFMEGMPVAPGVNQGYLQQYTGMAETGGQRALAQEERGLRYEYQDWQRQQQQRQIGLQEVSQFGGTFEGFSTRGEFAIQRELRNLSKIWEEFTQDYQEQQHQMQYQQFMENWQVQAQRMPVQFGWQREDLAYQGAQQSLQYGWGQEDIQERMRYATGRERRQLMKQQDRSTIQYAMGMGRLETEEGRVDTREQWAKEDLERQKRQFMERWQLEGQYQDQYRRYSEERRRLEDELQRIREFNARFNLEQSKEQLQRQTELEQRLNAINEVQMGINYAMENSQALLSTFMVSLITGLAGGVVMAGNLGQAIASALSGAGGGAGGDYDSTIHYNTSVAAGLPIVAPTTTAPKPKLRPRPWNIPE